MYGLSIYTSMQSPALSRDATLLCKSDLFPFLLSYHSVSFSRYTFAKVSLHALNTISGGMYSMVIEDRNLHSFRKHIQRTIQAERDGRSQPVIYISAQPHYSLVEVLREFVYVDSPLGVRPVSVNFFYRDWSQGAPFPLYCLVKRNQTQQAENILPISASLIGMRHLRMDAFVDIAWFLNSEIAKLPTHASVEEFCYQRTREQLQECLRESPLKLHLYQTGFPPALIGFYRALVEQLQQNSDQPSPLTVIPYYYAISAQYYWHGTEWN
jgi:hypothetical protein